MKALYLLTMFLAALTNPACAVSNDVEDAPDASVPRAIPTGDGLLILTTMSIRQGSRLLDAFVQAKERRNFRVRVATEADHGAGNLQGQERARRVRDWLKTVYTDYRYLLLIGDGQPDHGDLPMFTVWPRHAQPAELCGNAFALDCRSMQTDFMYGELTGNWDRNGNGRPGEHGLDDGPDGIDFHAELVVGRIPVYFGDASELDRILAHAMTYMDEPCTELAWRQETLLPAALFYLKGQRLANATAPRDVDGADITEWLVHNVLAPKGITTTRLYEQEGIRKSVHSSDASLTRENMLTAWSRGQGIVYWQAHGLPRSIGRVVWSADENRNGLPEGNEITNPVLLHSADMARVPAGKPAFVLATSCEVGSADIPDNLAHAALMHGAAVGFFGSSNVTPGDSTDYTDVTSTLDTTGFGASNAGILVIRDLLDGKTAAESLSRLRVELGTKPSADTYAGKMMLNSFGDPTLGLRSCADDTRRDE